MSADRVRARMGSIAEELIAELDALGEVRFGRDYNEARAAHESAPPAVRAAVANAIMTWVREECAAAVVDLEIAHLLGCSVEAARTVRIVRTQQTLAVLMAREQQASLS